MNRRSFIAGLLLAPFARSLNPLTSYRSRFTSGGIIDGHSTVLMHIGGCHGVFVPKEIREKINVVPVEWQDRKPKISVGGRLMPDGSMRWDYASLDGFEPLKPEDPDAAPRKLKYPPTAYLPWVPKERNESA